MTGSPQPRTTSLLNGIWRIQPSDDALPPDRWDHEVPVPALVDVADPQYDWRRFRHHWYRTTFENPNLYDLTFLVVEQAMFGTEVWVNGKHVGGDIACYTSQEYDVARALKPGAMNELIVRVGRRADLPPHSAVGKDQERTEWIPGIWGDVLLVQCGNPRVRRVQVIPHIEQSVAEVRITIDNSAPSAVSCVLTTKIVGKASGKQAGKTGETTVSVAGNGMKTVVANQAITGMHLWSPQSPYLYEVEVMLTSDGRASDVVRTIFGMREFAIRGRDLLLNGQKIYLRGGNIAFHRFLSDVDRGILPWDLAWVKRLLVDIPKAHHFNFFRSHIGQMYNRWYDLADEHGMLLQNEWMFWTTTGTREQISHEFTRWLEDNWNHPSIIIWDPLNESSDAMVQNEIVPAMKELDPTRPWESVDIIEEHPYIYSLGPVLNDRRFGFTRSLEEIERSTTPTMLNEFCWWWLDKEYRPSRLMEDVVERWLGPHWTKEELIAHQPFLVQELVELFRRMRVDAIQPFVYLSNNAGPTAHWFAGDISALRPKPILAALRNAFAPFGVSIELWDRHFTTRERRTVKVFVFNDHAERKRGTVSCGVVSDRGERMFETTQSVVVEPCSCIVVPVLMLFPSRAGRYTLRAEVHEEDVMAAFSEKEAHVFDPPPHPHRLKGMRVAVLSRTDELPSFLAAWGMDPVPLSSADLVACAVLVVGEGMVRSAGYRALLGVVAAYVNGGGTLVVVEPEFGVEGKENVALLPGIDIAIEHRLDTERGGYDSYVFPVDTTHPLWDDVVPAHLRMFNGGYGGEVVSQHNVVPTAPHTVLARCGLRLGVMAACEIPSGKGRVIVSRLQVRGRLMKGEETDSLYARRVDPVLQRYLLNLLSWAVAPAAGSRNPV